MSVSKAAWLGIVPAIVLAAGCSVKRIDNGVYHSPKGYRVAIPGPAWTHVVDSPADLELRHLGSAGTIAANATCEGAVTGRARDVLARQLLIGIQDRQVIERDEVDVAGRPAARTLVDARQEGSQARVRIETIVLSDKRCVYDLVHVAAPDAFADTRADFTRFVDSFRTD